MTMAIETGNETEVTRQRRRTDEVSRIVARVTAPQNRGFVVNVQDGQIFLQVEGYVRDLTDPTGEDSTFGWQRGSRQWVSPAAKESDIFRMMLAMLIAFDEHETREAFLVDGVRVFGPHVTIDALKHVAHVTEV